MVTNILHRSDMIHCLLCHDAPCNKACPNIKPESMLRSIWFANEKTAASRLPAKNSCADCSAPCEKNCVRAGSVPIQKLMTRLHEEVKPALSLPYPEQDTRLRANLCGIPLENPFLLSSSVVGSTYDMCARAFEAGWAGVSFKTICSFDIHEASPRFSAITGDNGSIIGFKNIEQLSDHSLEENMEILRRLKQNYPSKCLIASIMGRNDAEWEALSRLCEENGADAIELNFSCPNMEDEGLGSDIGQEPKLVEQCTAAARRGTKAPILAKLTPNVARMSPAAEAAIRGGADGISAINTIKSIIGIHPDTYVSSPEVHGMSAVGGYSGNAVKPIALRFIAELSKNPVLADKHISGMGGIESWQDALEFILLGAGSLQVTTAVMQYGYRIVEDLKSGLNFYLAEKGFASIEEARGRAVAFVSETTDVLERDTIAFPKLHHEKCIGCGRCVISCADGGHQALALNENRKPLLNGKKCVGCQLCVLVCPQHAISNSGKWLRKT